MTPRVLALTFSVLAALLGLIPAVPAQAQGLKLQPAAPAPAAAPRAAAASPLASGGAQRAADFIVVVVNSEPITNSEVRTEVQRLAQQYAQQRRQPPPSAELVQEVLDRMINDKVQLQLSRDNGIRIEDVAVDQAEQNVARQNSMDVPQLRRQMAVDGVRVSDLEIDQYRRDQQAARDPAAQEINIAQILVAVPDAATAQQATALQAKAQAALERARAGEDFAALARELSDSADKANGGQLGLRNADRLPPLFVEATQNAAAGALTPVLRSGAGFHVLKVIERRTVGQTVAQARARHILLRATATLTEAAARDKLDDFKRRIEAGQADFAALARDNSQDGSAAQGGDLGWASPGQFVPEFEAVVNSLSPGQVSAPLISRFGVHLIQLMERRTAALSQRDQNEVIRSTLREKKLDAAYATWARDMRGRAYVEMRGQPQI